MEQCIEQEGTPMHSKAVENKATKKDVTCIHCIQDGIELASVSLFDSVLLNKSSLQGRVLLERESEGSKNKHHKGDADMSAIGTLLDLCVSSLRRGHANLLCIVPILLYR